MKNFYNTDFAGLKEYCIAKRPSPILFSKHENWTRLFGHTVRKCMIIHHHEKNLLLTSHNFGQRGHARLFKKFDITMVL